MPTFKAEAHRAPSYHFSSPVALPPCGSRTKAGDSMGKVPPSWDSQLGVPAALDAMPASPLQETIFLLNSSRGVFRGLSAFPGLNSPVNWTLSPSNHMALDLEGTFQPSSYSFDCERKTWGSETAGNLPKVTQLVNCRARDPAESPSHCESSSQACVRVRRKPGRRGWFPSQESAC